MIVLNLSFQRFRNLLGTVKLVYTNSGGFFFLTFRDNIKLMVYVKAQLDDCHKCTTLNSQTNLQFASFITKHDSVLLQPVLGWKKICSLHLEVCSWFNGFDLINSV